MENQIQNMKEERANLVASMSKIVVKAKEEKRDLNSEEKAEWDKLDNAQEALVTRIESEERASKTQSLNADLETYKRKVEPFKASKRNGNPINAFRAWALYRTERGCPADWLEDAASLGINLVSPSLNLSTLAARTGLVVGTGSAGGYFTESERTQSFEKYLRDFNPMRQVATVVKTSTGGTLPYPTVDDTTSSNNATIKAEQASIATNLDPTFGQVNLGAFKYSSGNCKVSIELLQDSLFPIEAVLNELLAERIGAKQGIDFTTGGGTTEPWGIVSKAGDSTFDINGAAVSWTDILDLIHSVGAQYRVPGRAKLMFNDATAKTLKKLITDDGYPLFMSLADGAPGTFDGWGYVINNAMADLGTGSGSNTKPILFGLLDKYVIRDVGDVVLYRLDELYQATQEVGFGAHMRSDGNLVNTSAVKYLKS